jgi:hypothetical protein
VTRAAAGSFSVSINPDTNRGAKSPRFVAFGVKPQQQGTLVKGERERKQERSESSKGSSKALWLKEKRFESSKGSSRVLWLKEERFESSKGSNRVLLAKGEQQERQWQGTCICHFFKATH